MLAPSADPPLGLELDEARYGAIHAATPGRRGAPIDPVLVTSAGPGAPTSRYGVTHAVMASDHGAAGPINFVPMAQPLEFSLAH